MPETPWTVKDIIGFDEWYFADHPVYIRYRGLVVLRVMAIGVSSMDDYYILYCRRLDEHWCSIGSNRHESDLLLRSVKEG